MPRASGRRLSDSHTTATIYRILTRQGKNGPGGAKNYIVDGKMTGGFAFVAYPAEYRSSGVMTFIVNQDGVVYQKDLGKKTDVLAKAMKEYNPNSSWQKGEDEQEESAGERGSSEPRSQRSSCLLRMDRCYGRLHRLPYPC
jgi:hypothetical protein